MKIFISTLVVYFLNIPFGYWRTNVKNFSAQWFFAVHVPVVFVILIRIFENIGFEFYTYPLFIIAFFLGQYTGSKVYSHRKNTSENSPSSCLVMDTYRLHKP